MVNKKLLVVEVVTHERFHFGDLVTITVVVVLPTIKYHTLYYGALEPIQFLHEKVQPYLLNNLRGLADESGS